MTEKEKMLAGKLYFAEDEELSGLRRRARNLCHEFNATNEDEKPRRREIIRSLFGHIGRNPGIHPSFHCDYGFPIRAGDNFYANYDLHHSGCLPGNHRRQCYVRPAGLHLYGRAPA